MPASGPRPGSGVARSRRFLDGTLAPDDSACSTSPGQPEPQVFVLFVRLVVVAIRRTRVPSIIVEGTAPPHVMTAFRVRVYQDCPAGGSQKTFRRGGMPPRAPPRRFLPASPKQKGKNSSDSPGQPEPQVMAQYDRKVGAKRRTREPTIIVEGTAPPHVSPAALGPLRRRPLKYITG